jgi:DNA-binding MarR family transcriptional regulator
MTYLLDDLQKAGLVVRQPHPGDRRVRQVAVTAAGGDRLAELDLRPRAAEEQQMATDAAISNSDFSPFGQAESARLTGGC